MHGRDIEALLLMGIGLIALGMTPGLLSRMIEGLANWRDPFRDFPAGVSRHTHDHGDSEPEKARLWLIGLGSAFLLLAAYATFSN